MLVVFPNAYGMCFGVKDALVKLDNSPNANDTTIWGELVHNPEITRNLRARGFAVQTESARSVPPTAAVVITAHGISDTQRTKLVEAGKEIIDTTCPLVRKVHRSALFLHNRGYHIAIVGKPGHVEVEGLVGDLERYTVIASPEKASRIDAEKIAVLAQTTTPPALYQSVLKRIQELHPGTEVRVVDTVCQPTRDRQQAMEDILPRVDAVVVVGGKTSNNTRRLFELAQEQGKLAWHVERADEILPFWFENVRVVGIAAGTSTPDETIQQVHRRILELAPPVKRRPVAFVLRHNPPPKMVSLG